MARKPAAGSLTADDWLQAGYALLSSEGVRALKIERLCTQVGATRGSFYWHFTDLNAYRGALVDSWNTFLENDRRFFDQLGALPPRERLAKMMTALVSPAQWTLERAMREWARSDETAAANVRAADLHVLTSVRQAFLDYGFDEDEADLRAGSTFAVGIGMLHLVGSAAQLNDPSRIEQFLDLMLTRRD